MAKDERMRARLTRHSHQTVSSPSPYMVVDLFIFIPISHIVLVPKVCNLENMIEFRPISLCNVLK